MLNWLKRKDEFDLALDNISNLYNTRVGINLRLKRIDRKALEQAGEWHTSMGGAFDWHEIPRETKFNSRKRFVVSIAMWVDDQLCGLAIGRRSKAGKILVIFYIEGSPSGNHPLKGHVLKVVDAVAQEYASTLPDGLDEIWIADPLPELIRHYEDIGYFHLDKVSDGHKYSIKALREGGRP